MQLHPVLAQAIRDGEVSLDTAEQWLHEWESQLARGPVLHELLPPGQAAWQPEEGEELSEAGGSLPSGILPRGGEAEQAEEEARQRELQKEASQKRMLETQEAAADRERADRLAERQAWAEATRSRTRDDDLLGLLGSRCGCI